MEYPARLSVKRFGGLTSGPVRREAPSTRGEASMCMTLTTPHVDEVQWWS